MISNFPNGSSGVKSPSPREWAHVSEGSSVRVRAAGGVTAAVVSVNFSRRPPTRTHYKGYQYRPLTSWVHGVGATRAR